MAPISSSSQLVLLRWRAMLPIFARAALAVSLVGLAACSEPAADVAHPKSFAAEGLAFQYPGNWKVETSREGGVVRNIHIESPGSAVITIIEARPAIAMDLHHYATLMTGTMEKAGSVAGVTSLKVAPPVPAKRKLVGDTRDGLRYVLTITALGTPTPHTAEAWVANLADRSLFVWTQVADEDAARSAAGSALVLDSLRVAK
jgi:hypothetical protein